MKKLAIIILLATPIPLLFGFWKVEEHPKTADYNTTSLIKKVDGHTWLYDYEEQKEITFKANKNADAISYSVYLLDSNNTRTKLTGKGIVSYNIATDTFCVSEEINDFYLAVPIKTILRLENDSNQINLCDDVNFMKWDHNLYKKESEDSYKFTHMEMSCGLAERGKGTITLKRD